MPGNRNPTPWRDSGPSARAGRESRRARRHGPSLPARRTRLTVGVAAVFTLILLATSFPLSGLLSQHRQLSAAATQLNQLRRTNRSLTEHEHQLNSKAAIQQLARQRYQLVVPGSTLYDVLPPGGHTSSTAPGAPTSGDPGTQPPVAPADAPDLSPDPNLGQPVVSGAGTDGHDTEGWQLGGIRFDDPGSDDLLVPGESLTRILAVTVSAEAGRRSGEQGPIRPVGRAGDGGGRRRFRWRTSRLSPACSVGRPPVRSSWSSGPRRVPPPSSRTLRSCSMGRPCRTRFWLVDPGLREAVSRLESTGGVRQAEAQVPADEVADAHARYASERDALIGPDHQGPVPTGGVGGTRRGVKCLHAHLAWWLTGADDPVGEWTARRIGLHPSAAAAERP